MLEIGPGPGVLTDRLLVNTENLTCIEIDSGVCEYLRDTFPNLNLIEGDALQEKWGEVDRFISNLPYQISSPIIERITNNKSIQHAVILVQEEFAQRLVVELSSDRGSLGMCTKLDWDTKMDIRVAPNCFTPSPQVNSRLVVMKRIDPPENSKLTKMLIRQAFGERRKKLKNTLSKPPKRISRVKGWHAGNYKEAIQVINGELDANELEEKCAISTRQLVKRQLTWMRSFNFSKTFDINSAIEIEKYLEEQIF